MSRGNGKPKRSRYRQGAKSSTASPWLPTGATPRWATIRERFTFCVWALHPAGKSPVPESEEQAHVSGSAQQALNDLAVRDRHGPIVGRRDHGVRVDAHAGKQGGSQVLHVHRVPGRRGGL